MFTPSRLALATVLSFMAFTPVAAQDYQKGLDAYAAGDYTTVLQEWTPLAEAGDASVQYNLGLMYANGKGVPQDYAEAIRWYRLAADQGDAKAQYHLGSMYRQGKDVPQDYAEAVRWHRLAADQGYASAQGELGLMYTLGQGVLEDHVMAHMWYNISAANGSAIGSTARDAIAKFMTQQAIEQAQAMARECLGGGYTKCGY